MRRSQSKNEVPENNQVLSEVELEDLKQTIDYTKHLTTLSTGSILILATFLEKLFQKPLWKPLVATSFIGFMVSVIASVVTHTFLIETFDKTFEHYWFFVKGSLIFIILAWIGFLAGVISLGIFAIKNFLY